MALRVRCSLRLTFSLDSKLRLSLYRSQTYLLDTSDAQAWLLVRSNNCLFIVIFLFFLVFFLFLPNHHCYQQTLDETASHENQLRVCSYMEEQTRKR